MRLMLCLGRLGAAWRRPSAPAPGGGGALALSPATLPTATWGVAYNAVLTASGGTAPYGAAGLPASIDIAVAGGTITLSGAPT
jgi:large repetitive protein